MLTCKASGGVPDNYTYEWEHRTDADDHIRFLPSKPNIRITYDPTQSVGLYVCTVFGSFESITTDSQSAIYHHDISGDIFIIVYFFMFILKCFLPDYSYQTFCKNCYTFTIRFTITLSVTGSISIVGRLEVYIYKPSFQKA